MKRKFLLFFLSCLFLFSGNHAVTGFQTAEADEIDRIISGMTLDEKISQMIIPAMRTWNGENVTDLEAVPELKDALQKHQYGGIILYGTNISGTDQVTRLLYELQVNNKVAEGVTAHIPYFTPVDEEGGIVLRLTNGTRMTGNMAIGAAPDPVKNAEITGEIIGEELAAVGFNIDYAPVVDVNNNPANPVIGTRSFSDDPAAVSRLGIAYAEGLQKNDVIATFKHFPGHGDTGTDSHLDLPSVEKTYEEISKIELVPFRAVIENGADMIMTAHITYPLIDEQMVYGDGETTGYFPATMSKKMITDILRTDLGFDGVVVTDALEMDAIRSAGLVPGEIDSAEYRINIAEKVINAGVDMLLLPADMNNADVVVFYDEYISGLAEKVESGEIPAERIDESVRRILHLKAKYGIFDAGGSEAEKGTDIEALIQKSLGIVGSAAHHEVEMEMAGEAITVLKNDGSLLPLSGDVRSIVFLGRLKNDAVTINYTVGKMKKEGFLPEETQVEVFYYYDSSAKPGEQLHYTEEMKKSITEADVVVGFSYTSGISALQSGSPQYSGLHSAMEDVHNGGGKFILLSTNLPYDAARYQEADAIVLAYMGSGLGMDPTEPEEENGPRAARNANIIAAIETIFGSNDAKGRLPVNIPVLEEQEDGSLTYGKDILYPREYLRFEDGMAMPVLEYSDPTTPNEDSEIQRFVVYVETDHDTDGDGKADLVKVFMQVPRAALEGKYKAAVIFDPTPYPAGVYMEAKGFNAFPFAEKSFDYAKLYEPGSKRESADVITALEAAGQADPDGWLYQVPGFEGPGYYSANDYDYYLIRGFAVAEAGGIGTYGSEGFELCGFDLERDAQKNVVEWLTGDRRAFTDLESNIEVKADWCNGNVAMTGLSYGGTLPYEVAVTGVKGLKTIIPFAGISNWYDYVNAQGIPLTYSIHYTDILSSLNSGGLFEDDGWLVPNDDYGAALWQIGRDQLAANGNYAPIWEAMDYSRDHESIDCSALIVHGLNDFNVQTKQSVMMYQAFKKAGKNVKLLFHQNGHNDLYGFMINDQLFDEVMNRWLSHYVYDIDNGIEDWPEVTVQSNIDGTYSNYDKWESTRLLSSAADNVSDLSRIENGNYQRFFDKVIEPGLDQEEFYMSLEQPFTAVYPLDFPAGETIYGAPEVHVRIMTDDPEMERLMVTALLLDTVDEGSSFKAYITKSKNNDKLPVKTIGSYDFGGGYEERKIKKFVPSSTDTKIFGYGWTDLHNPGMGYESYEYTGDSELDAGCFYDYTIYLSQTAYTVAEGHTLKLLLMAEDPYRTKNDDSLFKKSKSFVNTDDPDRDYSFVVDNSSIEVIFPVK